MTYTETYEKSSKYTDFNTIYAQCSGPGGLKLAEFMADKIGLKPGDRLLDVGANRGYQTCFLAKEFDVSVIGIDPWLDRMDQRPMIEHVMENAQRWGVQNAVLGIQVGVPETKLASCSFDAVYSTTALEMIRGMEGEDAYRHCMAEIYRVLRPQGIFGLAEPMHLDVELPADLATLLPPNGGEYPGWLDCFRTIDATVDAVKSAGFEILEADYASDATAWWNEFAQYDPFCQAEPDGEATTIRLDNGRWLSLGYIIARKPE